MNKQKLIQRIIDHHEGITNGKISSKDVYNIFFTDDYKNSDIPFILEVDKLELIGKINDRPDNEIGFHADGIKDWFLNKKFNSYIESKYCGCSCGHENGTSTYCPNCGWKLLSYTKFQEPKKLCSTKWCQCTTPTLIRNIHIEKRCIRFTHWNDIDTVSTMNHSEVEQFVESSNRNSQFERKVRCLNLADKIQVYTEFPYKDDHHEKTVPVEIIQSLGCFINVLGKLGYRIQYTKHEGYGDFHIISMKKEEC